MNAAKDHVDAFGGRAREELAEGFEYRPDDVAKTSREGEVPAAREWEINGLSVAVHELGRERKLPSPSFSGVWQRVPDSAAEVERLEALATAGQRRE